MFTLLLLAACSEPAPAPKVAPANRKLRVALNWYPEPEFGGFYEALLDGSYAARKLDVELIPGGPGAPVLEMLQSGQAEVAISGADDLLVKRAKGLDAVAIFAAFQHSPVGLMAHEGGPATYAEVKGPVAIETGSPFQRYLWGHFGWEGKVEMVPSTGSIGPFAADPKLVQQAYVTSEPCVAEGQGLKVVFLAGSDAGWDPYSSLAVVAGKDKQEPWVKDFVEASREGWAAYLKDATKANAEIAKLNPAMPIERMGCITGKQAPFVQTAEGLGTMTEARWKAVADALGSIGTPVDPAGAWVNP